MQMDVKEGYTLPGAGHLLLSLSTPASFLPLKAPEHRGWASDPLFHGAATVTASFHRRADRLWTEERPAWHAQQPALRLFQSPLPNLRGSFHSNYKLSAQEM